MVSMYRQTAGWDGLSYRSHSHSGQFSLESCKAYTCLRCCSYYVPDSLVQRVNRTVAESCENQQNSATGQFVNPSEF